MKETQVKNKLRVAILELPECGVDYQPFFKAPFPRVLRDGEMVKPKMEGERFAIPVLESSADDLAMMMRESSRMSSFEREVVIVRLEDGRMGFATFGGPIIKRKVILVHPTKTAGCAINFALGNALDNYRNHYHNYLDICKDDAVIVLPVRNPYERIHSQYFYYRKDLRKGISFEDFVMEYPPSKLSNSRHKAQWAPCSEMVRCPGLERVNYIIRFESLEEDFGKMCDDLGIECKLKVVNENADKPKFDMSAFEPWMIEKVNVYFRKDFEQFGYEMIDVNAGMAQW